MTAENTVKVSEEIVELFENNQCNTDDVYQINRIMGEIESVKNSNTRHRELAEKSLNIYEKHGAQYCYNDFVNNIDILVRIVKK